MSSQSPAKFFVNQGVVTSRTDMLHLLRPLLKQTVTYRYQRCRELVSHGTGWVERIVVDAADTSTYFTPLAITGEQPPDGGDWTLQVTVRGQRPPESLQRQIEQLHDCLSVEIAPCP